MTTRTYIVPTYVPNNCLNHDTKNINLLRPRLGCIIIFYSTNHITIHLLY